MLKQIEKKIQLKNILTQSILTKENYERVRTKTYLPEKKYLFEAQMSHLL